MKGNEKMKRFVVVTETLGGKQTRLVPAKNEVEARRNCTTDNSKVISCVPYTGQKVKVSGQYDGSKEERFLQSCMLANRRGKENRK